MYKIHIFDEIYVLKDNKVEVFDMKLNIKHSFRGSNIAFHDNKCVDIDDKLVKIYKNGKLYHSYELSKKVNNFIITDSYIISFENSLITIFSFIGNKILFSANVTKNLILDLIYKDDFLYILTENSIMILDLIKKKMVFNISLKATFFDVNEKYILAFNENTLYKIDLDKNIEKYNVKLKIDDLKSRYKYSFLKQNKNLYLFDYKELYLVSNNCNSFDIKDNIIYVLEDNIKKHQISKVLKKDVIKILTVDDSTTMRLIIKNSIINNFKNVEIYEAKNGKIALKILAENPDISIIFMDWNMPIMNGKETVIKIRENPKYDKIKIIMATTENDKDKIREMITYGVKGYLIKPLKATSVVPVTQKMIELIKEENSDV